MKPFKIIRRIIKNTKLALHDGIIYHLNGKVLKPYFIGNTPRIKRTSDTAVVLHLYHLNNWELFSEKLLSLSKHMEYDLVVTMPKDNVDFSSIILDKFPSSSIFIVPNRGRDVLPFIMVARLLYKKGYTYALKVHSKKSTHRDDGQLWLENMLESLMPKQETLYKLKRILKKQNTAIVGPEEHYYPLSINFPANGVHMQRILRLDKHNRRMARDIHGQRDAFGFFGGTMFWVRLSAIKPLLCFSESFFERESGQIDGTFAHALERMFCVLPELNGKNLYEISTNSIQLRNYKTNNIPTWSKDHQK